MTFWFVVPAAGVGKRFGGKIPKQYFSLAGQTIIEQTLKGLLAAEPAGVVVAIAENDDHWRDLPISEHPLVTTVTGGKERMDSVLAALQYLRDRASPDDWILVHDVVRPCVRLKDIQKMLSVLGTSSNGGILAAPMSDTVKRVGEDGKVLETLDRSTLWTAMTPQMFRYGLLERALLRAIDDGVQVTDESMAVEHLGYQALVVEGSRDNIKITRPEDLPMAEVILRGEKD